MPTAPNSFAKQWLTDNIGLAITLITVGATAAIGSRQARKRLLWLSVVAAGAL